MTVEEAIKQVESCNFECEAGPLRLNVGWQYLVSVLQSLNPAGELPVRQSSEARIAGIVGGRRRSAVLNMRQASCPHLNVHQEGSLGWFCNDCGGPV